MRTRSLRTIHPMASHPTGVRAMGAVSASLFTRSRESAWRFHQGHRKRLTYYDQNASVFPSAPSFSPAVGVTGSW